MIGIALVAVASYLLGSIPTSIIVGRLFFGKDLREIGSGNAGGTNAFRAFGWKGGVPTILVDIGKGAAATLLASQLPAALSLPTPVPLEVVRILAGCAAVVGHVWTVFAGFRGGKGVATAAGMILSLYPMALLLSAVVFAITLFSTGIVSVASMTAAVLFPAVLLVLGALGVSVVSPILFWFSIPVALLIVLTHRANIRRLISGTENRFPRLAIVQRIVRRTASRRTEGAQPPAST